MAVRDVPAVVAALLAAASVATHVWMLSAMPSTPVVHLTALAMAAACLWCGISLVRAPRVGGWTVTAVMATVMIGLHLVATGGQPGTGHRARDGGRSDAGDQRRP